MAKFIFKLQSYLGVKEKLEDKKKQEYGAALKQAEDEKEKKRAMEAQMKQLVDDLRAQMLEGINPQSFIGKKQYMTKLERGIIAQDKVIERAVDFAESKRIELLGAVKERKMLETLKEKQYEEYLIEQVKAEQKIVDEIVSYRTAIR